MPRAGKIDEQPRRAAGRSRLLAAIGLAALIGSTALVVIGSGGTDSARSVTAAPAPAVARPSSTPKKAPATRARSLVRITVRAVGAYDPEGDGSENDGSAALATDGNGATAWTSEHYRSAFTKSGVGLVVDAGRPVRASRVTVVTATPGFEAQIRVGDSPKGPFTATSSVRSLAATTTFRLNTRRGRYLVLWITSMPSGGTATVNELDVAAGG